MQVKGALQYDEYGPKQKYVRKLLLKAWKKPQKIDKFYSLLSNHLKEYKNNTIINLKILLLLHSYLKKGPMEAIEGGITRKILPENILKEILENWNRVFNQSMEQGKSKDLKRCVFTTKLIINFSKLIQEKLILNKKYKEYFEGNFSLNPFLQSLKHKFKPLEPELLFDLFNYLDSLIKFSSSNLLQVGQLWNLQACLSLSILDEMYCLLCMVLHLYKTFKLSTNFESYRFDSVLISKFVQERDTTLQRMYLQIVKFFTRCSQITETAIPVASMIPKLPLNAVDYIKSIEILTNSCQSFNVFEHLNYQQNIFGLKLPLSFGPGIIDAISRESPSFSSEDTFKQIVNKQDQQHDKSGVNNSYGHSQLHEDCEQKLFASKQKQMYFQKQQGINLLDFFHESESPEKQETSVIQVYSPTKGYGVSGGGDKSYKNKENKKPLPFVFWDEQPGESKEANTVFDQFNQNQQEITIPNREMKKKHDLFLEFNKKYCSDQKQSNFENFLFHPSHPNLIESDKKQKNQQPPPPPPKLNPFNIDNLYQSLQNFQKNKDNFVLSNFSNLEVTNNIPLQNNSDENLIENQESPPIMQNINVISQKCSPAKQQQILYQLQQQQQNRYEQSQQLQNIIPESTPQSIYQSQKQDEYFLYLQPQQTPQSIYQQQQTVEQHIYQKQQQDENFLYLQPQQTPQSIYQYQQQVEQHEYQDIQQQQTPQYQDKEFLQIQSQQTPQSIQQQQQQAEQYVYLQPQQTQQYMYSQQQQQQIEQHLQLQPSQTPPSMYQQFQQKQLQFQFPLQQQYNNQSLAFSQQQPQQYNNYQNIPTYQQEKNNEQYQQLNQNMNGEVIQQLQNSNDFKYYQNNSSQINQNLMNDFSMANQQPIFNDSNPFNTIPQDNYYQNQVVGQISFDQMKMNAREQQETVILFNQNDNIPRDKKTPIRKIKKNISPLDNDPTSNVKEAQNLQNPQKKSLIMNQNCENIIDEDIEGQFPLQSIAGCQRSWISVGNTRRSITHLKHQNSKDDKKQQSHDQKVVEEEIIKPSLDYDQFSLFENHLQLINFIQKEVSSEFLDFIINIKEVQIGVKIGSGKFQLFVRIIFQYNAIQGNSCEVFKGIYNNNIVAVKIIKMDSSDMAHLKEFQREISALIKLKNHENLLQLIAISSIDNNFYIITEFCEGGNLFDLLHKKKAEIKFIPWSHRLSWIKDIAQGMSFLHKNRLIHRDLKSLNLLFNIEYNPKSNIIPSIKIADFGLTKVGGSSFHLHQSGVLGTFHWMAPETMRNEPISTKSDVYSFAVSVFPKVLSSLKLFITKQIVMWELCSRQTPFKNLGGVAQIIKFVSDNKGRPELSFLPFDTPRGLRELIILCWDENPNNRPDFDQITILLNNPQILA